MGILRQAQDANGQVDTKEVVMAGDVAELGLVAIEEGEVGEEVVIETPVQKVRATWLGTVSSGKELAEAMRLMWDLAAEREASTG